MQTSAATQAERERCLALFELGRASGAHARALTAIRSGEAVLDAITAFADIARDRGHSADLESSLERLDLPAPESVRQRAEEEARASGAAPRAPSPRPAASNVDVGGRWVVIDRGKAAMHEEEAR